MISLTYSRGHLHAGCDFPVLAPRPAIGYQSPMAPPRSKLPKGRTAPLPPKQPGQLRLSTRSGNKGEELVVWLERKGARPRKIGSVNRRLAADARRHGQDLVGALVDEALLQADRRS